jgi:N-acetyl-anhydromuramyl-L-alanine amidase AmpD
VHCTATRADWWSSRSLGQKIAEVRKWHVNDRGWSDIGYHFLIDRNGKVGAGRPLEKVGAHVVNHNSGTIGISLFGGYEAASTDDFLENFTSAQDAALRQLIQDLGSRFSINRLTGHNEYANKACPGFAVGAWYA